MRFIPIFGSDEPKSDPPMAIVIILLLCAVAVRVLADAFGLWLYTIIENAEPEVAEELVRLMPTLIWIALGVALFLAFFIGRPPLIAHIIGYLKEKYDLWYFRHWPHKVPFGEKWNRMLERLDYMRWLEQKGVHFTSEDV